MTSVHYHMTSVHYLTNVKETHAIVLIIPISTGNTNDRSFLCDSHAVAIPTIFFPGYTD
jgi:hypothetical protein